MLNFYYPNYNENELELSKDLNLLNDYLLLKYTLIFKNINEYIVKNYNEKDTKFINEMNNDLFDLIIKKGTLIHDSKINRIKIIYYYKFFNNYKNFKCFYDYLLFYKNNYDYNKLQEILNGIYNNINLNIYMNILKKYKDKYKLKDIQIYFDNEIIIENNDLKHYHKIIKTKPLYYLNIFIIIFIIYLILIMIVFFLILFFQKKNHL